MARTFTARDVTYAFAVEEHRPAVHEQVRIVEGGERHHGAVE